MEQWVLDGRDAIRDRGFSRIPTYVEEDGYTGDVTGGLRGMLKKVPRSSLSSLSTTAKHYADPEAKINFAKGLPQLYAECEVDYEYRFNGRIVDSNKEQLAVDELVKQLAVEAEQAERMAALEKEMEAQAAAALADESGIEAIAAPTATGAPSTAATADSFTSKIIVDGTVAFPTPQKIPTVGTYYPLDLVLGAGQVTQAMDEALLQMHEGEETEWWIDPAFAFRDHGLRTKFGSIPADAAIQMKLKLVRFENPMSSYQRILYVTRLKDEANAILSKALKAEQTEMQEISRKPKDTTLVSPSTPTSPPNPDCYDELMKQVVLAYNNALTKLGKTFIYKQPSAPRPSPLATAETQAAEVAAAKAALSTEKTREEQMTMDAQLRAIVFTNLSLCWFKRDDLARSTEYIERALKCNPFYCKGLFRRALIEERRCNFDEAIDFLQQILSIIAEGKATDAATVNIKDVEAKITALQATSAKQDAAQRKTFQGMFSKGLA